MSEVIVDDLVSQMAEEARSKIEQATELKKKAQAVVDSCDRDLIYWTGRADSISKLLEQARGTTVQEAAPTPTPQAAEPEIPSASEIEATPDAPTTGASTPRGRRSSRKK